MPRDDFLEVAQAQQTYPAMHWQFRPIYGLRLACPPMTSLFTPILQLYTTAEYPCSYLPTQQARSPGRRPQSPDYHPGLFQPDGTGLSPQRKFHLPPALRPVPSMRITARCGGALSAQPQPAPHLAAPRAPGGRASSGCTTTLRITPCTSAMKNPPPRRRHGQRQRCAIPSVSAG